MDESCPKCSAWLPCEKKDCEHPWSYTPLIVRDRATKEG